MKPRICSVSYLNSTPLIWGLLHGPQQGLADLRFELPATCADLLRSGETDIGLVPVIELERQPLEVLPGLGIASSGPVRSILLVSKVAAGNIRSLAADAGSRTSVVLTRILLAERFGSRPCVGEAAPDVGAMLAQADACLLIGDPALRVGGFEPGMYVYDLGAEWREWSRLPMVYAVWASRPGLDSRFVNELLQSSWQYGRERIPEIAIREAQSRGISAALAREYLHRNIDFELSDNHVKGALRFRRLAREHGLV